MPRGAGKKVKIAQIGLGYFGLIQARAWLRIPGAELIGIVDKQPDKAVSLQSTHPEVAFYDDVEQLLAENRPTLIDIATPPDTHYELISRLAGSVPYVICQKPFCRNLQEAETLVAKTAKTKTSLIVHENFRFMPWYRKIREVLKSGMLGEIRQASFRFRPGDGNGALAYLDRQPYFQKMERFLIHESAIHFIDVFRFLFGETASVYADLWATNPIIVGEDSGLVIFKTKDGPTLLFDGNRTLDHSADDRRLTMGEMVIEGSEASLSLKGNGQIAVRQFGTNQSEPVPYVFSTGEFGGDCVFHFQSHVVDHLIDGTTLENAADEYLANLAIEEAIYNSAKEGRRIFCGTS